jgi:rubredoxin
MSRLSNVELARLYNSLVHGDKDHREWLHDALLAWSNDTPRPAYVAGEQKPLPMILTCPSCGNRHIDKGMFATKPHHTHACQSCGIVWRPAIIATVGVQFLPGFKDEVTT